MWMAGLVVDGAAQVRMLGQVKRDALCGNTKCTLSQARAELSNDDGSRGGGWPQESRSAAFLRHRMRQTC